MRWSRSTNEGWYLLVVGWCRDYSEFFSKLNEDEDHNYLLLIVIVEDSKCHLDKQVFASTSDIARYIDIWGKKFARDSSKAIQKGIYTPVLSLFRSQFEVE